MNDEKKIDTLKINTLHCVDKVCLASVYYEGLWFCNLSIYAFKGINKAFEIVLNDPSYHNY